MRPQPRLAIVLASLRLGLRRSAVASHLLAQMCLRLCFELIFFVAVVMCACVSVCSHFGSRSHLVAPCRTGRCVPKSSRELLSAPLGADRWAPHRRKRPVPGFPLRSMVGSAYWCCDVPARLAPPTEGFRCSEPGGFLLDDSVVAWPLRHVEPRW